MLYYPLASFWHRNIGLFRCHLVSLLDHSLGLDKLFQNPWCSGLPARRALDLAEPSCPIRQCSASMFPEVPIRKRTAPPLKGWAKLSPSQAISTESGSLSTSPQFSSKHICTSPKSLTSTHLGVQTHSSRGVCGERGRGVFYSLLSVGFWVSRLVLRGPENKHFWLCGLQGLCWCTTKAARNSTWAARLCSDKLPLDMRLRAAGPCPEVLTAPSPHLSVLAVHALKKGTPSWRQRILSCPELQI